MAWEDLQETNDPSFVLPSAAKRGGSMPGSVSRSKMNCNRTRVWMHVLSFLVVVLLIITCTLLAITVNDDKETETTSDQKATEIIAMLEEHLAAKDDPPDQQNTSVGRDNTPTTTTAPIPTASPSVSAFPNMHPTTEGETSQPMRTAVPTRSPFTSIAPFSPVAANMASPLAAFGETSQPVVVSPTASPVVTDETSQPVVVSPTKSPVATGKTSQPAATGKTSQPVVSPTESPVATGVTSQPVVLSPIKSPVATSGTNQPVSPGMARASPENLATGNETWLQVGQEIVWENVTEADANSLSLSRDGTTVAIGQFGVGLALGGRVDVYRYDDILGLWKPLGRTIQSDRLSGRFGYSVALNEDGTVLAIGDADDGSETTGRVLVFEFLNDVWVQLGVDIDGGEPDRFAGRSVALSDDGLVLALDVQITSRTPGPPNFVRVYRYNGNIWNQIGQDVFGEEATLSDTFSLSLSGNGMIFAISSAVPGFGYLKTYTLSGQGTWDLQGEIKPSSSGEDAFESIGLAVSLSGNGAILATGVRKFQSPNLVRCFQFANSAWSPLGSDIDTKGAHSARRITLSMSTDGDIVAIGPQDDTPFASVHAYDVSQQSWPQIGKDIAEDPLTTSGFQLQAISLSGTGSRVAVFDSLADGVKVYTTTKAQPN